MNHFKIQDIKTASSTTATHEDMGLCYVSKFQVGLETFYSVTPQADNPDNYSTIRVEQAKKDLLARGYWWDGVL